MLYVERYSCLKTETMKVSPGTSFYLISSMKAFQNECSLESSFSRLTSGLVFGEWKTWRQEIRKARLRSRSSSAVTNVYRQRCSRSDPSIKVPRSSPTTTTRANWWVLFRDVRNSTARYVVARNVVPEMKARWSLPRRSRGRYMTISYNKSRIHLERKLIVGERTSVRASRNNFTNGNDVA